MIFDKYDTEGHLKHRFKISQEKSYQGSLKYIKLAIRKKIIYHEFNIGLLVEDVLLIFFLMSVLKSYHLQVLDANI